MNAKDSERMLISIMSILNGKVSYKSIKADIPPFGAKLSCDNFVALNGCMSIAVDENQHFAFALSDRGLIIFDISNMQSPKEISSVQDVSCGRDIKFYKEYVYVAARENGLYIIDVRNPFLPKLVYIYDTLELATSVDVSNDTCFVSNRHFGVELIDVKNPACPEFVSSFMCGEAQSVYVYNNYAYIGDWMNKEVYIFNVSDIRNPQKTSVFNVDGFADGVCVYNDICFVATGHHNSMLRNRYKFNDYPYITADMINSGYGCGHGLEIFDVSDPYQPEYISSVKFPPLFGFPDLWKVTADDTNAYVSDSNNGLFIVNIKDLVNPCITAYFKDEKKEKNDFTLPQVQIRNAPITNCLCLDGYLYLSGYESGIHIIKYTESKYNAKISSNNQNNTSHKIINAENVFNTGSQIHSLVKANDTVFVAAGNGGLIALDKNFIVKHRIEKNTLDVKMLGNYIISASGQFGLNIYEYNCNSGFNFLNRIVFDNGKSPAREIAVLNDHIIAVQLGTRKICFVNVKDHGKLDLIKEFDTSVMMYYRNLSQKLFKNKYFAYSSLNNGFNWFEITNNDIMPLNQSLNIESCPIEDGIATINEYSVVISRGKYTVLHDINDTLAPKFISLSNYKFKGIPFVFNDTMVVINRCNNTADVFDISNVDNPILNYSVHIPKPSSVQSFDDEIFICCGHDGIFKVTS